MACHLINSFFESSCTYWALIGHINMLPFNRKIVALLSTLSRQRLRHRLSLQRASRLLVVRRRHVLLRVTGLLVELLTILEESTSVPNPRSGRRLRRNGGWWELVWTTYSDERVKETFHVSKGTFQFILERLYASSTTGGSLDSLLNVACSMTVKFPFVILCFMKGARYSICL